MMMIMIMMIIIIIIDGNNDRHKYCGWKETCFRLCSLFQTDVASQAAVNRLGLEGYALFKSLSLCLVMGSSGNTCGSLTEGMEDLCFKNVY